MEFGKPACEKTTELSGDLVHSQTCGQNDLPFMLHFKLSPGRQADSSCWALFRPRVGPVKSNQQLAAWNLLTEGSDFWKIRLVLQNLIKFLLAITDFHPGPVIAPGSYQYLKMRENNNGHHELSTYDIAGTVMDLQGL